MRIYRGMVMALVLSLAPAAAALAGRSEPLLALSGLDPVELVEGRETPGAEALTSVGGHYRYRFSSVENKARYDADPLRYSVQLGGSCARMGPMSGLGSPERYLVHEGRIYLFASDACMNRFKGDPGRFLDGEDPVPEATAEERSRGEALVALALEGLGGQEKVDALGGLRWRSVRSYKHEGRRYETVTTQILRLPADYLRETSWGTGRDIVSLGHGRGFRGEGEDSWEVDDQERWLIRRDMLRHPIALLRARQEPGFHASVAGGGEVDGANVEWLRIWHNGAQTLLGIDPDNGRIRSASWQGWTRSGIGEVMTIYSRFRRVSGLTLPTASRVFHDGKPTSESPLRMTELIANPDVDPVLFEPGM